MLALKQLYNILMTDPQLKESIQYIQQKCKITKDLTPQQFIASDEHRLINQNLKDLRLKNLQDTFKRLPELPNITAIILKCLDNLTIAFLMIPKKKGFVWHDHQQMCGFSKCMAGQILIQSLNIKLLQRSEQELDTFTYKNNQIRTQKLNTGEQSVSNIYPDSFNIHRMSSIQKQSAFIDILIPQYQDETYNEYDEIQNISVNKQPKTDEIKLIKISGRVQQVIGIQSLIKQLKQKSVTKTTHTK